MHVIPSESDYRGNKERYIRDIIMKIVNAYVLFSQIQRRATEEREREEPSLYEQSMGAIVQKERGNAHEYIRWEQRNQSQ